MYAMCLAEKNVMKVFLNSYFLQVGSICYYLSKKKKKKPDYYRL